MKNKDMKRLLLLACASCTILSLGCENRYTARSSSLNAQDNKDKSDTKPSNVTKVLNRVQCIYSYCDQNTIDTIWQICLENGYQTEMPTGSIQNSRDMKELVSGTRVRTRTETSTSQQTDINGIVTNVETTPVEKSYTAKYEGYCLGSEYISQN